MKRSSYLASADREANLRAVLMRWQEYRNGDSSGEDLDMDTTAALAGDAPDVVGLLRTAVGLAERWQRSFGIGPVVQEVMDFLDLPAVQQYRTKEGE